MNNAGTARAVSGFTLLELLIGLSLLGFIMVLLFSGFWLATRNWDAVENHAQKDADVQAAIHFIRRTLGTVQPLRLTRLPGQPLAFAGQADRVTLVAPLAQQVGLRTIELAIDREQGSAGLNRLILREGPPPYGAPNLFQPLADATPRVLIADLDEADFSFFGSTRPGEPPQWHEVWQHPLRFPSLVRVHAMRRKGGPINLVIATHIDADPGARVNIVAGPAGMRRR